MELWKNVIDNMQANELNQNNMEFTSELLSFQCGYVAWKLGNKFEVLADEHNISCKIVEKPFYDPKKRIASS